MGTTVAWSLGYLAAAYGAYWWFAKAPRRTRHHLFWSAVTALAIVGVLGQVYSLAVYGTLSFPDLEPYPRY